MKSGEFTHDSNYVGCEMVDGRLVFCTILDESDDAFHEAAVAHCSDDGEFGLVSLAVQFKLSDALDCLLDNHQLVRSPRDTVGVAVKPCIIALKGELQAMLDRIERIRYEDSHRPEQEHTHPPPPEGLK